MHYYTPDGRAVLDGTAGLWCTNAGHNRDPIVAAIRAQAAELDYAPAFQFAHPKAFELASRVAALAPKDLDHVFFCNSGSEAVDTALKIALAYHKHPRRRFAHAPDRARARLSRRRLRRHLGRRHCRQPEILRLAVGRRRSFAGDLEIAPSRPSARASRTGARTLPTISNASLRCTTPRPSLQSSSSRWRLDRRAAAAERLSPAPARDLRQVRPALDLRRGHHRLRPARLRVRRRTLRRHARYASPSPKASLPAPCRWVA